MAKLMTPTPASLKEMAVSDFKRILFDSKGPVGNLEITWGDLNDGDPQPLYDFVSSLIDSVESSVREVAFAELRQFLHERKSQKNIYVFKILKL